MRCVATKWLASAILVLAASGLARAGITSETAEETAALVIKRYGPQVAKEGAAALAEKIEVYAARYGEEETLLAVRRVGPEAFTLADAAGADAPQALRVLAREGEEGATWIVRRPVAMRQVARYGDEAAAVLVKHPGVAEPLIESGGATAVKALAEVTPQGGRRIAMLMEEEIGKLPESGKLIDVIAQYGQRACDFIWANKGALAVGTTLAAFVANPEPFLNGAQKLATVGAETVAKPLAEGVAHGTNWTLVILVMLAVVGVIAAVKLGVLRQPAKDSEDREATVESLEEK